MKIQILATMVSGAIAQSWSVFTYFGTDGCGATSEIQGARYFSPAITCGDIQAVNGDSSGCIGSLGGSRSGGCLETVTGNQVETSNSLGFWVPERLNATILAINGYDSDDGVCDTKGGSISVTQMFFLADTGCHAIDGSYFRASCNARTASVVFCSDSDCNDCSDPIGYQSGCNVMDGVATSFLCSSPLSSSTSTSTSISTSISTSTTVLSATSIPSVNSSRV